MPRILNGVNQEVTVRLAAALLTGGLLGLNRELHGKPAGFRTHALVSLGAAVATIVALRSAHSLEMIDPNATSRVVQGILTGVGFLGAGVILRDPAGHVTGLTTAATIWICAILGMVCGLGYWQLLGAAVALAALALVFGRPLERMTDRLFRRKRNLPPDRTL